MPLIRRIPKRGFNNSAFKTTYAPVNLCDLETCFHAEAEVVDERALRDLGLVKGSWDGVKILGDGEITRKFRVRVDAISASARWKVESAGGTVELLPSKKQPTFDVQAAKAKAEQLIGYPLHAISDEILERIKRDLTSISAGQQMPESLLQNNVHAIGFGKKYVGGRKTETDAIRYYVLKKASREQIPGEFHLPRNIDGIPTDIIEMGPIRLLSSAVGGASPADEAGGPAASGVSNPNGGFGTLGAYCHSTRDGEQKRTFLLSCKHVLFADPNNDQIHQKQPGTSATRHVAKQSRYVPTGTHPVTGGATLIADAAIAELIKEEVRGDGSLKSSVCHIPSYKTGRPIADKPATKVGQQTGMTRGELYDANLIAVIAFPNGAFRVENHIVVWSHELISDAGDSGALLVQRQNAVVGICYAGSTLSADPANNPVLPEYTFGNVVIASPIQPALRELGVTL